MTDTMVAQKRLTAYGTLHKQQPAYLALDDILDREVTITGVAWFSGTFGDYAVMDVLLDGQPQKVRTGASLVIDALRDAEFQNAFPVVATFTKRGRTYRFS